MSLSQIFEGVIYKITNQLNNKVYVGSCVYGLRKRKNVHLHNLRKGKHHSRKLQNAYNKYGEESFIFDVLESCTKETIIQREQYWIDYFDSFKSGYNSNPKAANCEGREVKPETRIKISNSLKGREAPRTKEHNKNLGVSHQKKVVLLNNQGEILEEFDSTLIAAKRFGKSQSTISEICNNKRPRTKINLKFKDYEAIRSF